MRAKGNARVVGWQLSVHCAGNCRCKRSAEIVRLVYETGYFAFSIFVDADRSAWSRYDPACGRKRVAYCGVDLWKQRVGYSKPNDAYLILIDRQGTIKWLYAGPFDEPVFLQLAEIVRSLGGE